MHIWIQTIGLEGADERWGESMGNKQTNKGNIYNNFSNKEIKLNQSVSSEEMESVIKKPLTKKSLKNLKSSKQNGFTSEFY